MWKEDQPVQPVCCGHGDDIAASVVDVVADEAQVAHEGVKAVVAVVVRLCGGGVQGGGADGHLVAAGGEAGAVGPFQHAAVEGHMIDRTVEADGVAVRCTAVVNGQMAESDVAGVV